MIYYFIVVSSHNSNPFAKGHKNNEAFHARMHGKPYIYAGARDF
jgi:hypothetical protein